MVVASTGEVWGGYAATPIHGQKAKIRGTLWARGTLWFALASVMAPLGEAEKAAVKGFLLSKPTRTGLVCREWCGVRCMVA